jgi:hypothetical protein
MSDRGLLYFGIPVCMVIFMLLVGCGEPASCWSDQRATFRPCDEVRRDQINREIDKRSAQADCKSGAGCCRPRVQDTEDPKIECNDEDWRK